LSLILLLLQLILGLLRLIFHFLLRLVALLLRAPLSCLFLLLHERTANAAEGCEAVGGGITFDVVFRADVATVGALEDALETDASESGPAHATAIAAGVSCESGILCASGVLAEKNTRTPVGFATDAKRTEAIKERV